MSAPAERRRWLFVDAAAKFGGHEIMLLRWLEQLLLGKVVEPRLLSRNGSRLHQVAPEKTRSADSFLPDSQKTGCVRALRSRWHECKTLRRVLAVEKPECVVFVSGSLGDQMLMVAVARMLGARVLVYVPLLDTFEAMGFKGGRIKDLFVRWVYGRVPHAWVAISEGQAAHFKRWARPSGEVFVLPNTVGAEMEEVPRLVPRELDSGERIRVLVLGRLDAKQKGLDMLLAYLATAPIEVLNAVSVCIAGEGPYREVIESQIRSNDNLARCLTLRPWVKPLEVMAESDFLWLTSRFEGVPLVMLEAMAIGLPVISTDLPGTRDYVSEKCLFEIGDIASAIKLMQSFRAKKDRMELAIDGYVKYTKKASREHFSKSVQELLANIRRKLLVE
jgi:glycosyltransferase involved in cell wall biosynthesis